MDTDSFPWQKGPSELIRHAIEHSEKNTDFDRHMAYLVLDVGVEMMLKVFLANRHFKAFREAQNKAGRDITFHQLVETVKQVTGDKILGNIENANYFHDKRNKLYHEGDGFVPTEDNLQSYIELAKNLLKDLLGVDINKSNVEETTENLPNAQQMRTVTIDIGRLEAFSIDVLSEALKVDFEYFLESCAIITEHLHPHCATREFAKRYASIKAEWPDSDPDGWEWESRDLETFLVLAKGRVENQNRRLKQFNDLTGKDVKDGEFVDLLLEDINHLYVIETLKELSSDLDADWDKYWGIYNKLHIDVDHHWSPYITVPKFRSLERETDEQILEIHTWLESQNQRMDDWINGHIKGISRKNYSALVSFANS